MSVFNRNHNIDREDPLAPSDDIFSDFKEKEETDSSSLTALDRRNLSISPQRCHTSTEDFRTGTCYHLETIPTATYQEANYSLIDTANDVYQPTISFTDDARYKEIMRRRMRRRQMRKAQLIFRDNLMTDQEDRTSYYDPGFLGRPPSQSTKYCDIDANDDATLWMLLSLSGKLLRTKNTFGEERNLGERILIRQIAEKAFNHLFPPIKV